METLNLIKELATEQFGIEPQALRENVPVEELGIDSLSFLEFIFLLEERFGIRVAQENSADVKTLRDLATLVDALREAVPPPVAS